jgi:dTDP-4-dehydrorhamnose reductase
MTAKAKKRLLITGLSGKVGYVLTPLLKERYLISGIIHRNRVVDQDIHTFEGSLADASFLEKVLDQARPDFLLHLGAVSTIPLCRDNPTLAYQVNVEATAVLSQLCSKHGIQMLYTSTDMVFDGQRGGYSEDDPPSPISVYARTKMEAEKYVLDNNFLVFRIALNYGISPPDRPSYFNLTYQKLLKGEPVILFEDEIRSMLYTPVLAPLIIKGLEDQITGLYHVGGPVAISRLAFGQELCKQMGIGEELLVAKKLKGDKRFIDKPPDLSLNIGKLRATFPDAVLRTPAEGIADFLCLVRAGEISKRI